jgi:hypothetical protein
MDHYLIMRIDGDNAEQRTRVQFTIRRLMCLIAYVFMLVCACLPRRRRGLLWLIVGYAAYLAFAWFVLFAALDIEVFFD